MLFDGSVGSSIDSSRVAERGNEEEGLANESVLRAYVCRHGRLYYDITQPRIRRRAEARERVKNAEPYGQRGLKTDEATNVFQARERATGEKLGVTSCCHALALATAQRSAAAAQRVSWRHVMYTLRLKHWGIP